MIASVAEQLELGLFRGEPWDGRSPRGLTRVGRGFTLRAQAAGREPIFSDPNQYDIWTPIKGVRKKVREAAPEAVTLFPLPKRWSHG